MALGALVAGLCVAGCGASGHAEALGEAVEHTPDDTSVRLDPTETRNPVEMMYPGAMTLALDDGGYLGRVVATEGGYPVGVIPWVETTVLAEDATLEGAETIREARLGRDERGVLLFWSYNPERELLTTFDPPLRLAPASMEIGQTHERETALRLEKTGRERTQREPAGEGAARVTTTRLAAERVTTPAGSFDAHRVDVRLDLELGRSRVERLTRYALADSRIVVMETTERVVALGFTVKRERRVGRAHRAAPAAD